MTDAHDLHKQERAQYELEKQKHKNSAKARWHRAYIWAVTRVKIESLKNMNSNLRQEVAHQVDEHRKKGSLIQKLQLEAREMVENEDWSVTQEATKGYGLAFGPTDIDWEDDQQKEFMTYDSTLEGYHEKQRTKKRQDIDKLNSQKAADTAVKKK